MFSDSKKNIDNCFREGEKIANYLKQSDITVLGPSAALIPKINNIYCIGNINYKHSLYCQRKRIRLRNQIFKICKNSRYCRIAFQASIIG